MNNYFSLTSLERKYFDIKRQEAIERDKKQSELMLELRSHNICPHTLGKTPVNECSYWPCKNQ
jgi:hypothetical protein